MWGARPVPGDLSAITAQARIKMKTMTCKMPQRTKLTQAHKPYIIQTLHSLLSFELVPAFQCFFPGTKLNLLDFLQLPTCTQVHIFCIPLKTIQGTLFFNYARFLNNYLQTSKLEYRIIAIMDPKLKTVPLLTPKTIWLHHPKPTRVLF